MVIVQKAITYLQINAHVYTKYYVSIFFVREVRILTADRISQSCLLARRRTESTTGNSKFVSYRIHSVTYRAGVHTRETVRESRHVKHCCRGQPGIPSFYPSLKVATRVSFENCSSVEEFLGCRHFAGIRIFQSRQFSNNGSTPTDLSYLMHSRNRNQKYLNKSLLLLLYKIYRIPFRNQRLQNKRFAAIKKSKGESQLSITIFDSDVIHKLENRALSGSNCSFYADV